MISSQRKYLFFYLLSFVEGGVVMATELIGARLLAPWFGTSLYVWTSVMALTLGGLASGYFLGGRLSQKNRHERILLTTVLLAAIYICCLPFLSSLLGLFASSASLIPAVLISSAIVLLPSIFLLGMVSPLLIKSLTNSKEESGKKAGEVYAISTLGGILFCFLTGFYLIPSLGLNNSLLICSVLLAIFPCVYFLQMKKFVPVLIYLLCGGALILNSGEKAISIYASDGLLGRLEVRNAWYKPSVNEKADSCQLLLINNVIQSAVSLKDGTSRLEYSTLFKKNLELLGSQPRTALVLGLGGGVLASELSRAGVKVTAVELDDRIVDVAKKYFNLEPRVNVIQDDARHALNRLNEKFDLIVLDLFHAEVTPTHVLSLESFEKMHSVLSQNGKLLINTYGYLKNEAAAGNQILLHTLQKAGFYYKICTIGDKLNEDFRNFEIIVSLSPITLHLEAELEEKLPDLSLTTINTDDRPVLEYANALAAERWRSSYLKSFIYAR